MADVAIARALHVLAVVIWLGGVAMVARLDLWDRFAMPEFWWMHAMVCLWALFSLILFVAEPLIAHHWLEREAATRSDAAFARLHRLHWVLLVLGALTILAAVAGSNGLVLYPV